MAIKPIKLLPRIKKIASGVTSFWGRGGTNEFYPGGADDQRRFGRGKLARDIAELMQENRQKMLLGDSRYIYQSFSTVSGAVKQKANYVYGNAWRLQSYSADAKFALAVEEDFKKIDRLLDTRGTAFSFRKSAWLGSKTIDVDGDYFIVLTENAETGFPKLQYLEAHRVGSFGLNGAHTVTSGRYKGLRIFAGVIVDEYMQPIAYRVQDESSKEGHRDVNANSMIHVADLEWFSQSRGQPTVAAAILDWYDLAETRDAEKIAEKVNSALTLVESNETGRADMGNSIVNPTPGSDGRLQTQLMDSGLIRYIKNGGSLKAHQSNRPSDQWLNFTKLVESSAFYALGWRREMLDSSAIGGAGVRGFAADINKSIASRREVIDAGMKRAAIYVIAKRAKQGVYGKLPEDWWKIGFTKAAQFTVDEGRMRAADISDLRAGLTTEDHIVEARGMDYEDLLRKRAANLVLKKKIAEENGLNPTELGTTAMPGDPVELIEEETGEDMDDDGQATLAMKSDLDFATLKAKFDSYGVAVRAGSITPQKSDEDAFRAEAGLPEMSDSVTDAWVQDGGYRRPITLRSGSESQADIETAETLTEETSTEET
jgi:hypothetical protein